MLSVMLYPWRKNGYASHAYHAWRRKTLKYDSSQQQNWLLLNAGRQFKSQIWLQNNFERVQIWNQEGNENRRNLNQEFPASSIPRFFQLCERNKIIMNFTRSLSRRERKREENRKRKRERIDGKSCRALPMLQKLSLFYGRRRRKGKRNKPERIKPLKEIISKRENRDKFMRRFIS